MSRSRSPAPPATFADALVQAEADRHACRLAVIKEAEGKLRMFDETWKALLAKDIRVDLTASLLDIHEGALLLTSAHIPEWDCRLHDALIDLGYAEEKRTDTGRYSHRVLKRGRLKLKLFLPVGHEKKPSAGAA